MQRRDADELTWSSAAQREDEPTGDDHKIDSNSDSQQLDDVITDEQETDANEDDQLPAELESHGQAVANEDVDQPHSSTPRYNLRDPSTRRPPSKYK